MTIQRSNSAFARPMSLFMDTHFSRYTSICVENISKIPSERPLAASSPVSRLAASSDTLSHSVCPLLRLVSVTAGTKSCVAHVAPLSTVAPPRSLPKTSVVRVTAPSANFNCSVLSPCICSLSIVWQLTWVPLSGGIIADYRISNVSVSDFLCCWRRRLDVAMY